MAKRKITIDEVRHVAGLARLSLTEAEVRKFQKQLSSILDYISILNEVKTEKVEPTAQVTGLLGVTRKDRVDKRRSLSQEEALANAPDRKSGFFKVKPILGS